MGAYSQFHGCSIGSSSFQLKEYGFKADPVIKNGSRMGTKYVITGEGWIDGTDAADLSSEIAAVASSLNLSGQDIQITGLNGVAEVMISGAETLGGGPHVAWEMVKGSDEALTRRFTFSALAESQDVGDGNQQKPKPPANTFKTATQIRPDLLRVVTISGEINGVNSGDYFSAKVLPTWRAAYSLPNWVMSYQSETSSDASKTKTTYAINAEEQNDPLPTAGVNTAVQGTAKVRADRDEQMRRLTVYEWDLLVDGDAQALITQLRPKGVTILRESYSVTSLREQRVNASFTILDGGDGSDLLDWQQTFKVQRFETNQLAAATYPGAQLILYKIPVDVQRWTQSGRAVGAGRFPRPAPPLFDVYAEPSQINFEAKNGVECETTWTYSFLFDVEPNQGQVGGGFNPIVKTLASRPNPPLFY